MFLEKTDRLALVDFENNHINYKDLINNIKYFSEYVIFLKNNKFALIVMENRPEWIYSFFAIWDKKSPVITIDALSTPKEILYVLEDSHPELVACSNETEKNILEALTNYSLKDKIKVINVDNFKIEEEKLGKIKKSEFELYNPEKEETAVMLYTSGTTGVPKGVMLTYNNLDSEIEGIYEKGIFDHRDQILALLPFHHILPLTATVLLMMRKQVSVVFVEKIASKEILEALAKNRVTALIGVPRVFKLFYDGIKQQIDAKFITRTIYKIMTKIKLFPFRRKVFSKVHEKFGGNLRFIVSGGAKLDTEIGEFYEVIGIYCLEGYGLTETSPVIGVNSIKERKIGTIGKKLFNVDVKVIDEELWVKGPIVMKGYYNKPEKTSEVMTEDGWFKTGDLANIDNEGYISIRGRKNSMIVLSNGKNIDPESLENNVISKSNYLIKEIGVFGHNDKLVAIIVPELLEFRKRGITNTKEYIKNVIEDYNLNVHNYEKILDYKIFEEELPKTRMGKIRRFMLPNIYNKNNIEKKKIEEPTNEIYKMLKEYVKKMKGIEPNPEENLELEIGMDSLDVVEFLAYIENSFGIKIDEEQFLKIPNLKLLSEFVEEKATKMEDFEVDWKKIIDEAPNVPKRNMWIIKVLRPMFDLVIKLYFRLKRIDRNKIEEGPQIFVSNHQSFIDALVLSSLLPRSILYNTMFLAIDWYFKKGILKSLVVNGNVIVVDINKNIKKSVEEIAAHVKAGRNVLIFPEGARTKNGKVNKFKKVFAIIAKELDVEVQCLGIKGAFEAYSRYMKFPKSKKIEVAVLEKFKPDGTYDEIVQKAENIIKEYVEE
ncbi:MAG: AMP-binding protein [Leptotrichiaceae bacterium]|nr:AMP-binding protein [Leptotrichiaceae bacterium]MBP6281424.1 AMP-binding protein [Leptotrichiaceae bacterium]MBP7100048.1 AMP-binding protein [Leptotrichiaceae bacterium]MBP7725395.1 AMP-binding protein [Leptotrichiaceae bacterium]MBP9628971.1 AMP-binding protein [Leptotrichiaceae bacterium]